MLYYSQELILFDANRNACTCSCAEMKIKCTLYTFKDMFELSVSLYNEVYFMKNESNQFRSQKLKTYLKN